MSESGAPPAWPYAQFREYLLELMRAAHIPDFAELSRRAGVSQTQFSNWNKGKAQPSQESLNKLAPVLRVSAVSLWVMAGIATPADLDLSSAPDVTVLPVELRDLLDLWADPQLTDEDRESILASTRIMVTGVRAIVESRSTKPSARPRHAG